MKTRTRFPFLCLLALLSFLMLLCAPAAQANPVLTIGNASGLADTSVTVSVTASGLSNADRWSFKLVYDKYLVNFVSADPGWATRNWLSVLGEGSNGTLTVTGRAGVRGSTLGSGNLQICTITFRIKSGVTTSTVNLVPFSPTDGLNRASLNPGYISITTLSPPVLTIGSATGAPDKDVSIAVTGDGLNKATAWSFNLAYDSRLLTYPFTPGAIKAGAAISDWGAINARGSAGNLRITAVASPLGTPISGNKLALATLTFHVKPGLSQATTTTIALTPSNPGEGLKGANLKAGKVTIPKLTPKSLKIGTATGTAESSVTVAVTAGGLVKVNRWSFNLLYDSKRLSFIGVDPSWQKTWLVIRGSGPAGNLLVEGQAGNRGTVLNGSATLCAITFRVKSGVTSTTLALTPKNPAYGLTSATLTAGQIKVPAVTPVSLKLPNVTGTPDTDVTVALTASGLKNATYWSFKLAYDQNKLSFVKLAPGTATAKWGAFNATGANGNLTLSGLAGAAAPVNGDNQQIGVLTLHVKPGITSATIPLTPSAPAGALKNAALTAGQVKIAALPSLTVGTGSGDVGATVPVTVTAGNLTNPKQWSFKLTYDPAALRFVSIKPGTATKNWDAVNARESGRGVLELSGQAGPGGIAISGTNQALCQLYFTIKTGPGTTCALTPSAPGYGLTGATLKAGSIKVNGNPPLTLALGRVTATVGADVVVPTTATGLSGSTAWGLDVVFDNSKIAYVALQKGKATAKWAISGLLIAPGKVRITAVAGSGATAISGNNQELLKITFHVNSGKPGDVLTLTPSNTVVGLNGASLIAGRVTLVQLVPTLALGSASGAVGANVTVPATATDLNGSKAWGYDVKYDATKLTFVSVATGTATRNWASVTGRIVSSGVLRVTGSAGTAGSGVSGSNQELCKMTFKIAAGSPGTSLPLTPVNPAQDLAGANLKAGKVTIAPATGGGGSGGGTGTGTGTGTR